MNILWILWEDHSKLFQNTKTVATNRNSTENIHTRTKRKMEKFEHESKKKAETNIFTVSPKTILFFPLQCHNDRC